MNPNGFVFAASITSQTSMFIRSQRSFSSFASAMFTQRKMFSRSFVSSASRVPFTGTTLVMAEASGAQPGELLEDRPHHLVGGARIGRALQHDQLAGAHVRPDGPRCVLDVRHVRLAVRVERGRHA